MTFFERGDEVAKEVPYAQSATETLGDDLTDTAESHTILRCNAISGRVLSRAGVCEMLGLGCIAMAQAISGFIGPRRLLISHHRHDRSNPS